MSSSHIHESPTFYTAEGEVNKECFIVFSSEGIRSFSAVLECLTEDGTPAAFGADQKYEISVSPDAYDAPPSDPDSFEETILHPRKWLKILEINLPENDSMCGNSYSDEKVGMSFPNCLHFKWIKISVGELQDKKVRYSVGTR